MGWCLASCHWNWYGRISYSTDGIDIGWGVDIICSLIKHPSHHTHTLTLSHSRGITRDLFVCEWSESESVVWGRLSIQLVKFSIVDTDCDRWKQLVILNPHLYLVSFIPNLVLFEWHLWVCLMSMNKEVSVFKSPVSRCQLCRQCQRHDVNITLVS